MTAGMAMRLGLAAGLWFPRHNRGPCAVIGKDAGLSGYMIGPALTASLITAGMNVVLLGPVPTPAVAMPTRSLRADLVMMNSASHNPSRTGCSARTAPSSPTEPAPGPSPPSRNCSTVRTRIGVSHVAANPTVTDMPPPASSPHWRDAASMNSPAAWHRTDDAVRVAPA